MATVCALFFGTMTCIRICYVVKSELAAMCLAIYFVVNSHVAASYVLSYVWSTLKWQLIVCNDCFATKLVLLIHYGHCLVNRYVATTCVLIIMIMKCLLLVYYDHCLANT